MTGCKVYATDGGCANLYGLRHFLYALLQRLQRCKTWLTGTARGHTVFSFLVASFCPSIWTIYGEVNGRTHAGRAVYQSGDLSSEQVHVVSLSRPALLARERAAQQRY